MSGRAGGLAGGAGYDLQDLLTADFLARMLGAAAEPADRRITSVAWERTVGRQQYDIVVDLGRLTRFIEVKATAPSSGWTLAALLREGVIPTFWETWRLRDDEGVGAAEFWLCSTAPAKQLTDLGDWARRRILAGAEEDQSETDLGLRKAKDQVAAGLGIAADDERLDAFLARVHSQVLAPAAELEEAVRSRMRPWGEAATLELFRIVPRGRHTGSDPITQLDQEGLRLRLRLPAATALLHSDVDPAVLFAAAMFVTGETEKVAAGLAVTSAGQVVADVVDLWQRHGGGPLSSASSEELRRACAQWTGRVPTVSFDADLARWRDRLDGSPWIRGRAELASFVHLVNGGREAVADRIEPWLGWLQQGLLEGESAATVMTGRDWAVTALDEAMHQARNGFVVVAAGAGNGKTTFLRHLCGLRGWPLLLCRLNADPNDFRDLLVAVAVARGASDATAPRMVAGPPSLAIPLLLARLGEDLGAGERLVIALDDVDALASDPLESLYLPARLPDGVLVVCTTSRPTTVTSVLGTRSVVELDDGEDNVTDLRAHVQRRVGDIQRTLVEDGGTVDDAAATELVEFLCSGGSTWLYVDMMLDEMAAARSLAPQDLPPDLASYYSRWWTGWRTRVGPGFWTDAALPVLAVLLAVREPIHVSDVENLAHVAAGAVGDLVSQEWSTFLALHNDRVSWRAETHRVVLAGAPAPFVTTLAPLLRDAHGHVAALARHRLDLEPGGWWGRYALRHYIAHLLAAASLDRAVAELVGDAQTWVTRHARVASGNDYASDLRLLYDALCAAPASIRTVGQVLRLRAQLADNSAGTSLSLLAPAAVAGVLRPAQLALLLATDTDEQHAAYLRLFQLLDDASAEELEAAVDTLPLKLEFLGIALSVAPRRLLDPLVRISHRWWVASDPGPAPPPGEEPEQRRALRRHRDREARRLDDISRVFDVMSMYDTWRSGQLAALLASVEQQIGPEAATEAARWLLGHLAYPDVIATAHQDLLRMHLPADEIRAEVDRRKVEAVAFERNWQHQEQVVDLARSVRRISRGELREAELQHLLRRLEAAASTGDHHLLAARLAVARLLTDPDDPGRPLEPPRQVHSWHRGEIEVETEAPTFADVVDELETAALRLGALRRGGALYPHPPLEHEDDGLALNRFIGACDTKLQRRVADAVVHAAHAGGPQEVSFIEMDDWLARSRLLLQVHASSEKAAEITRMVLTSAKEQASTMLRRAILAPFAGRFERAELIEAVELSVGGNNRYAGDLAALRLLDISPANAREVLAWPNVSSAVRVRAWLHAEVPRAHALMKVAEIFPEDGGAADFAGVQRLLAGVLDPGGFHRDVTGPLAIGFEFGPLRTKGLLDEAIGACDDEELAAAAAVALAAHRLKICSEILGEMARRELPRTDEFRRGLVARSVAERRYEQAAEGLERLGASDALDGDIAAALTKLAEIDADADDDHRTARATMWLTAAGPDRPTAWNEAADRAVAECLTLAEAWPFDLIVAYVVRCLRVALPVPEWVWQEALAERDNRDGNALPLLALTEWLGRGQSEEENEWIERLVLAGLKTGCEFVALSVLPLIMAGIENWEDFAASGLVPADPEIDAEMASWADRHGEAGTASLVQQWVEGSLEGMAAEDVARAVESLDFLTWMAGSMAVFGFAAFRASLVGYLPTEHLEIGVRRAVAVLLAASRLSEEMDGEDEDDEGAELSAPPGSAGDDADRAWTVASHGRSRLIWESNNAVIQACERDDPSVWLRSSSLTSLRNGS